MIEIKGEKNMEWYVVKSTIRPEEVDLNSSKIYNYARKNIIETTETSDQGETITVYVYDEIKIPKESWGMYEELLQAQADIEYLNIITEDL